MILSNKTILTLEYRELLHLINDSNIKNPVKFDEAFSKMKAKFKRIDEIMLTIKIGDRFVWEDTDGGFETAWFDLEVVEILNYDLGIIMCIEPNSASKRRQEHHISRILTEAEFQTLMATKKK